MRVIKVALLYSVLFGQQLSAAETKKIDENEIEASYITRQLYGSEGLALKVQELEPIKKLLYALLSSSNTQLYDITEGVLSALKKERSALDASIKKLRSQQKPATVMQWYTHYLLGEQITYLEKYKQSLAQTDASGRGTVLKKIKPNKKELKNIKDIVEQTLRYITWERATILTNYPKVWLFLTLQKNIKLPLLIRFWDDQEHFLKLTYEAKKMTPKVEAQFLVDLILQTAIMTGESLYESWVSADDQKEFERYAQKEKKITDNFQKFQDQLETQQKSSLTAVEESFKKSMGLLDEQSKKSSQLLSTQINYLKNLIDIAPHKDVYLYDPIPYDNAFMVSPMLAPLNGSTWYNIYPVPNALMPDKTSDWEFDEQRVQFTQYNIVPFMTGAQVGDTKDLGQYAPNNAIFTEYITGEKSYSIVVEATLIGCTYPFFMGIMFNKARWISGVVERIHQYRLFGLYGTIAGDQKKVALAFAEYNYETGKDNKPKITLPLETIINQSAGSVLGQLDNDLVGVLGKNSTTFIFSITTSPTSIHIIISQKIADGSKKIFDSTIANLDPLIFIYHGIGFMAPGCQASFKIVQPQTLTYTDNQLKTFKNVLAQELENKKKAII